MFREKLKDHGYRVLIAMDPSRALQRYQQAPYHALVVDAGTAGDEGIRMLERVAGEAEMTRLRFGAVVILNENQAALAVQFKNTPNVAALVRPVTIGQIAARLKEFAPVGDASEAPPSGAAAS